ncbi:MAG: thiamine phosphate synthase [Sulfurimonas sp.]|nr:thiamine phosphate synthase [Sulfurimonas sp.]
MQLYALCDQDLLQKHKLSIEEFVSIANKHDAVLLQYRDKKNNIEFIKQQLIKIRLHYDGFLIVNDTYELIDYCDGVHLGQEDLKQIDEDIFKATSIVRKFIGDEKLFGISTHNETEVLKANEMDLNYIGLGAYKNTTTKKDISNILGSSIDTIASKSKHLVAAIGGVKLNDKFENINYLVVGSGLIK